MKTSSELFSETQTDLQDFFTRCRGLIESELDRLIPAESSPPTTVHKAIRWSLFAGGKRFRPALLLAVGETFGAAPEQLLATAAAVEMIHTYSLIHDDLPSMDDDDLRRGRPTCHVRFGEATATLAGDALQALAFQTITEDTNLSAETRVLVISELARGAGTPFGMVAGQAHDLEAESRAVTTNELQQIHQLKTGALIIAAARCGAIIANATGLTPTILPGLEPWNVGDKLSGQTIGKIKDQLDKYQTNVNTAPPGGEPFGKFYNRFSGALQKLMKEAENSDSPIITTMHSRNILAIPNVLAGKGPEGVPFKDAPANGSISVLSKPGGNWKFKMATPAGGPASE